MRTTHRAEFWVVYERTVKIQKKQIVSNAVCEQSEWEAIERAGPGVNTLVRDRIGSEEEAEKLARGTSGDDYRTRSKKSAYESPFASLLGPLDGVGGIVPVPRVAVRCPAFGPACIPATSGPAS